MNGPGLKNQGLALLALAVGAGALAVSLMNRDQGRKIAFVDSERLMTGFKAAHKINKEIQELDAQWRADLKILEDSLEAHMGRMTEEFDESSMENKKKMQDELSMRNQQVENFRYHQTKRMQKLTEEKLQGVYQKINAFMAEYGQKHGFDIIFGTGTGGIILYGTKTPADITNEVLELLNERYD